MKPLTAEWIDKAEGDYATVEREFRARKIPTMTGFAFMLSSVPRSISRPSCTNLGNILAKPTTF
jgi:hypothetical protein